jgi:hypothetical protein
MKPGLKALIPYIGVLVFIAIFLIKCPSGPEEVIPPADIPPKPILKTDSVKKAISKVDTFFQYRDAIAQKPDTVILYEITEEQRNSLRVDTTKYLKVIDSLNRLIAQISLDYLLLAPNSPKILSGEFSRNKLRLNLLKVQGNIEGHSWPTDYNNYRYVFDSLGLRAIPDPLAVKKTPKLAQDSYMTIGYDFFHRDTRVRMNYSLMYRNWGAYSSMGVNLGQRVQVQTELGLKLSIK